MNSNTTSPGNDALDTSDFEVVAKTPQAFYAAPVDVLCDADLTAEEKTRLLEEWVRDLEALAVADEEGMAPENDARRLRDTERLRAASHALGILRGDEVIEPPVVNARSRNPGRHWRKASGDAR